MPTPVRDGLVHLTSAGGTELALPSTITHGGIYRTFTTRTARLATGPEIPVAGPFPDPFDVFLQGWLQAPDAPGAQAKIDALLAVLMDAPIKLRLEGETADRYLEVYPQALSNSAWLLQRFGELSLQLRAHNPYWLSDEVVQVESGITSQPHAWSVNGVEGSVGPPPVITVDFTTGANGSNFILWNTSGVSQNFTVPGTFVAGDQLVIDTERMQVLKNGSVSYLDQMSDSFLLNGFPLRIGNNSLTAYLSGTIRMDVTISYRSRWI